MATKGVQLPRRTGQYTFVLTPLADAMFQLLIFFMLSSNLAPYSLLTIRSGSDGSTDGSASNDTGQDEAPLPPADAAIWNVDAGAIVVGGQTFGFDTLADLAAALNVNNDAAVVLIMRDTALVQDMSSVLEALTSAGIENIQIAQGRT